MRAVLLVLALSVAGLAQPQPQGLDFSVVPTLGDKYRGGLPLPLTVSLSNLDQRAVNVKVVARTGTGNDDDGPRAETTLTMAPGSRHTAQLLLPYGTYSPSVFLEVNGRAGPTKPFSSNFADNQDLIALLMTPSGTGFDYLGGYSPLLSGGTLSTSRPDRLANLPQCWQAFAGVDMLVLYDRPALHLTPAAEQALVDWTRAGGALVLVSNLDPGEYRGSPLEALLPLTPQGTQPAGSRTYLTGPLRESRVLLEEDGLPLLVAGRREAGQVFLVTTPIPSQDALGNALTESLWAYLLHEFRLEASPLRAHRFDENENLLARPPELPMPSAATLSWYLIGYVLLVGPVNYGLLRRKDRMLWIVFTVPALALVFSAGAYFTNAWSRSAHTVVREVDVLHLMDGSRHALLDGNVMVFSPRNRRYDLDCPLTCYARPRGTSNNFGYNSGGAENDYSLEVTANGLRLRDFAATMWSARHFRTFEVRELPSEVRLEMNSKGRLEANLPVNLPQAVVALPSLQGGPVALKRGETVRQRVTLARVVDPPGASASLARLLKTGPAWQPEDIEALAQMVTQHYQPCLVGFTSDDQASELRLQDPGARRHRLTFVVVHPQPKLRPPAPMQRPEPSPGASP